MDFFCFYKVSGFFFDFLKFLDSEFSKFSGLYFFWAVYVFCLDSEFSSF